MAEGNERLESLINSKNWKNLITFCEDYEIEVAPFESEGKKPFHGTLLLAYLIVGDLNNARYLWKRIPEDDRLPEVTALWELGKNIWRREYEKVHYILETYTFPPFYTRLINEFKESFKTRVFQLLSKSYNVISVEKTQTNLGFKTLDETVQFVSKFGWELDEAKAFFTVKNEAEKLDKSVNIDQLQQLAEYVLYLESF